MGRWVLGGSYDQLAAAQRPKALGAFISGSLNPAALFLLKIAHVRQSCETFTTMPVEMNKAAPALSFIPYFFHSSGPSMPPETGRPRCG